MELVTGVVRVRVCFAVEILPAISPPNLICCACTNRGVRTPALFYCEIESKRSFGIMLYSVDKDCCLWVRIRCACVKFLNV